MRAWPLLIASCILGCGGTTTAAKHTQAVVSAATPEAAAAGAEVLRAGGNAIDAAVATAFALFVSEPAGSGIGGQTMILAHAPSQAPFVIHGSSIAPAATPADASKDVLVGRKLSTVPNAVRTLAFALEQYGSGRVTWAQALEPAIRVAREGFRLGRFRHLAVLNNADTLRGDEAGAAVLLAPDGSVPPQGSLVRRPKLAATLQRLADAGPGDFFTGEIAAAIAADMQAHGGWITATDLADVPPPRVTAPVHGRYRGRDVYSLPPPCGGWLVLEMLRGLETTPTEVLRGDGPRRTAALGAVLDAGHRKRANRETPHSGETTHFSVVDTDGMVVGVTQSLNAYFGAKVMHPTLGFVYNDYMREFQLGKPDHSFALRAGAMPYSSMSATVVARDGRPELVLGSPGSARIVSAVVQTVSRVVDGQQGIAQAVAADRIHADGQAMVRSEGDLDARTLEALGRRGLRAQRHATDYAGPGGDPYFGGVHAVALEDGVWVGAADPRRDGEVAQVLR